MSRFGLLRPTHSHPSQDIPTSAVLLGLLRYRLHHDGPADLVQLLGRAIDVSFFHSSLSNPSLAPGDAYFSCTRSQQEHRLNSEALAELWARNAALHIARERMRKQIAGPREAPPS